MSKATILTGRILSIARLTARQFALAAIPVHEVYFALPFGMDFSAGWGGLVGTETLGFNTNQMQTAYGLGAWAKKDIGNQGFFVGLSFSGILGNEKPSIGFDFFAGWEF